MLTPRPHPLSVWFDLTGNKPARLARELGVHRSYITHITAGRRAPDGLLQRIADRTGIPVEKLRSAA